MKIKRLLPLLTLLLAYCGFPNFAQDEPPSATVPQTLIPAEIESSQSPASDIRTLPLNNSWQIQYTGEINTNLEVDIYNLDLFGTDSVTITDLHTRDIFIMCYFSAGSFEDWRPDINDFPAEILGKEYEGWPGEKWLDIRKIELLAPIMTARLDLASQKGCDGVDPDNVHGFVNNTGFPLTYEDQLQYNIWLAESAHERGLSIGLKNDLEQIPDLVPYFEWALNEECFTYGECNLLLPFTEANKPVFVIEYNMEPEEFCSRANEMNFNALRKNQELDAFRLSCR